jgi:uncharacterized protein YkwD
VLSEAGTEEGAPGGSDHVRLSGHHGPIAARVVPSSEAEWQGSIVLSDTGPSRLQVMGPNGTTALVFSSGGRSYGSPQVEEDQLLIVQYSRSPRHTIARAAGLASTALLAAIVLASTTPQQATGWNQGSAEATLFQLMNGARVNNGLRAVQQHSTLVSLARWRSKDQVERNYFDHYIKGTNYQVYHWYDINGLQYSWAGENIGWNNGYSDEDSPVAIHEGFMESPDHRRNVLDPTFTHGGVGAYAKDDVMFLGEMRSPRFYTELFMTAESAPPPPPPPDDSPSGGGGSGGTATAPASTEPVHHARRAKPVHVDAPRPPRASEPLNGPTVVASAGLRATVDGGDASETAAAPVAVVASSLRVEAPPVPERGLFETVVGSLLGFFL